MEGGQLKLWGLRGDGIQMDLVCNLVLAVHKLLLCWTVELDCVALDDDLSPYVWKSRIGPQRVSDPSHDKVWAWVLLHDNPVALDGCGC
jgi:hypothetical protein